MATVTQNLILDLASNRLIRANNHLVGVRMLSYAEGNTYQGEIELINGAGTITDCTIEIATASNDVALVRYDGNGVNYSLSFVGDLLRNYLYNAESKNAVFSMGLKVNGESFIIDNVSVALVANPANNTGGIAWEAVANKPDTFTPSAHVHPISEVTSLETALNAKADASTLSSHAGNTSNPHSVTKTQVGLSNADNTSDVNKPVSTATQTALNLKANSSHTHTFSTILQPNGNIVVAGAGSSEVNGTYTYRGLHNGTDKFYNLIGEADNAYKNSILSYNSGTAWGIYGVRNTAYYADPSNATTPDLVTWEVFDGTLPLPTVTASIDSLEDSLADKSNINHTHTKSDIGLGNVDNTSDANKPVSTATQTALNLKANSSHTHLSSNVTDLSTTIETAIDAKGFVTSGTAQTITGAKTFSQEIALTGLGNGAKITLGHPTYWGNNIATANAHLNGEGIWFCEDWGGGYLFMMANDGVILGCDNGTNRGFIIMDTFARDGHLCGFGFTGAEGMFYGDEGGIAHWQKTASISPDKRKLYLNNSTVSLDWKNKFQYGNWTIEQASGSQLTIRYNASNYFNITVSSTGQITFDAVGSGARFRFQDVLSQPQATKANNATGIAGDIAWDADYIYVCTATNTWKRTALTAY